MEITRHTHPEDINLLNTLLANAMYLQQVYKRYHWMLQGSDFVPLHRLFDEFSARIIEEIDELGERIRILDGTPIWHPSDVISQKSLPDADPSRVDEQEIIAEALRLEIAQAHALADAALALEHDLATQDILLEMQRNHEKQAWFLKQTLAQTVETI